MTRAAQWVRFAATAIGTPTAPSASVVYALDVAAGFNSLAPDRFLPLGIADRQSGSPRRQPRSKSPFVYSSVLPSGMV